MSSRLWLAIAFVLASGASPARAETSADVISVTVDQAELIPVPAGTTTIILGNPTFADVTLLKNNNSMVVTGKGFGQTNLIALNAAGSKIYEKQIRVRPANTVLVFQNGASRTSYSCDPGSGCMPSFQLGERLFQQGRNSDHTA
jgi:hypothetical protein